MIEIIILFIRMEYLHFVFHLSPTGKRASFKLLRLLLLLFMADLKLDLEVFVCKIVLKKCLSKYLDKWDFILFPEFRFYTGFHHDTL